MIRKLREMKLIEECSELLQAVCKGSKYGWDKAHPNRPHTNNLDEMKEEYIDVQMAFEKLYEEILKEGKA